jgi:hypothetical protein
MDTGDYTWTGYHTKYEYLSWILAITYEQYGE